MILREFLVNKCVFLGQGGMEGGEINQGRSQNIFLSLSSIFGSDYGTGKNILSSFLGL